MEKTIETTVADARSLFHKNVWLFLANAKMILENQELFYSPVDEDSTQGNASLSYLGVYLEWWVNEPYSSWDVEGNPVISFIGNPMTGSHSCRSIAQDGRIIEKCQLHVSWVKAMMTFRTIDKKYQQKKGYIKGLRLSEAIEYIKTHSTPEERSISDLECKVSELKSWNENLTKRYRQTLQEMDRMRLDFLRLIVLYHQNEFQEILDQQHVCEVMNNGYVQVSTIRLSDLKKRLKAGDVTAKDYQRAVGKIHKERRKLESDIRECWNKIEWFIFSKYHIRATVESVVEILNPTEKAVLDNFHRHAF